MIKMKLGLFMFIMLSLITYSKAYPLSRTMRVIKYSVKSHIRDISHYWSGNAGFVFCAGYGFLGVSLLGDQGQTYNTCMYYIE